MKNDTVTKVLISLDQESSDIVDFFVSKDMSKSAAVCVALKEFYKIYVQKSLRPGVAEIDMDGQPSTLDALVNTPRKVDPKEKLANAPVGDESGAQEDVRIESLEE